jgi:hypothetical protein
LKFCSGSYVGTPKGALQDCLAGRITIEKRREWGLSTSTKQDIAKYLEQPFVATD